MLFMKLLGLLDVIAAITLFIMKFDVWLMLGLIFGIYLLFKRVIFFSAASIVDIIAGILMLFAYSGSYMPLNWIFSIWLLQKGFFSMHT